jgi:putative membrane protein
MWGAHEGMGWWMVIGWVWFIVFWGVIIYLIFSLMERVSGRTRSDDVSPQEILKRRYARGEISKQQYDEMRRDLA